MLLSVLENLPIQEVERKRNLEDEGRCLRFDIFNDEESKIPI